MNKINVIQKMKLRLKTIKPFKNIYGTKTKKLSLSDYAIYALIRDKKDKTNCCHNINLFNAYIKGAINSLTYEIKNYTQEDKPNTCFYTSWEIYNLDELSYILSVIQDYIEKVKE